MKWGFRALYVVSYILLLVAVVKAGLSPMPSWFSEGVLTASVAAAIVTTLFWGLSELLAAASSSHKERLIPLAVASLNLWVIGSHFIEAAFYFEYAGDPAELDTFHLLLLSILFNQASAAVVGLAAGSVLATIVALGGYLAQKCRRAHR